MAAGRHVGVYGVSGETSGLAVRQLASLEHAEAVTRAQWDLWGNQLAASTVAQAVHVYMADLNGTWQRLLLLDGQP